MGLEAWQGDWWQEDGGPALAEVERDGGVQLRAAAAAGGGHLQELRGPVPHRLPGRQRCGHVGQDRDCRAEDGQGLGQSEVPAYTTFETLMTHGDSWVIWR